MAASEWWMISMWSSTQRWTGFWPAMRGHVLITCRVPGWSWPVEVASLFPELAAYYLLERSGQDDRASAAEVARLLEAGSIHVFSDRA